MADDSRAPVARALLQQCVHARLQVKPPEAGSEAEWVEVMSARKGGRVAETDARGQRSSSSAFLMPACFQAPGILFANRSPG